MDNGDRFNWGGNTVLVEPNMVVDYEALLAHVVNESQQRPTVRMAWAVDDDGFFVDVNDMFCAVMGYERGALRHHPARVIMRHHAPFWDSEIQAIWAKMQAVKANPDLVEHITNTWIQRRDGTPIEIPDCELTRHPLHGWSEFLADVDASYLPDGAAIRHQNEVDEHLRSLVDNVKDLNDTIVKINEETRSRQRERTRRPRSDIGTRAVSPDDFDGRLRRALSHGQVSVNYVLKATSIGSRRTLDKYLNAYRPREFCETNLQTIQRLGRLWFPDKYLL